MDYIKVIHSFIDPIVSQPEEIIIEEKESRSKKDRLFVIRCSATDMGRLIGKRGSTADALREVISIAGKNNNEHIHIKIATFDEVIESQEDKNDEETA